MSYVPTIDERACSGHGDCVDVAPKVFALDDEIAEVIGTDKDKTILKAAEACPSLAITVIDSETGETVFP